MNHAAPYLELNDVFAILLEQKQDMLSETLVVFGEG
jgi:hypothetical protein